MTPPRRRRTAARWGRTAVETAIVLNVLIVLLLAVIEYGRLIMIKQLMANAAREGARYAVVSTNSSSGVTTSQIQSYVQGYLAGQSVNNLAIQVYQADPNTGANVGAWNAAPFSFDIGVQIDLDYAPIVPVNIGIIRNTMHLTSKSLMRSEAN